LDECIFHGESGQKEKANAWYTGICLLYVNELKVYPYLKPYFDLYIYSDMEPKDIAPANKI